MQIQISGVMMIILSIMHIFFPKYFKWKEELGRLSLINKQMMQAHTFFIALLLLLLGILCITSYHDLTHTQLGKKLCLGIGLFWAIRFIYQIVGYSSILWEKKRFETSVHLIFLFIWSFLSYTFLSVAW